MKDVIVKNRIVNLNNKDVYYSEAGSGKPLILVHAWPICGEMFIHIIPILAQHYHVLAPDLPGFGDSEELNGTHTVDSYANFLSTFIERFGLSKVDLVGISSGGNIVLKFSSKYPKNTKKVIVQSPPYFVKEFISICDIVPGFKYFLAWFYKTNFYLRLHVLFSDLGDIGDESLELILKNSRKFSVRAAEESMREVKDGDLRPDCRRIKSPVLVIMGGKERRDHFESCEKLAKEILPNGEFVIVPGGTHRLIGNKCKEFCDIVLNFLKKS